MASGLPLTYHALLYILPFCMAEGSLEADVEV